MKVKFFGGYKLSSKVKQVLLWLMIISSALLFVWFLQGREGKNPQELSLDQVVTRIENKDIKEMSFKQSQVEILDSNGNKFFANLGSDPTRESLLNTIKEYNKNNTSSPIKYNEEPVSSGLFWIV